MSDLDHGMNFQHLTDNADHLGSKLKLRHQACRSSDFAPAGLELETSMTLQLISIYGRT